MIILGFRDFNKRDLISILLGKKVQIEEKFLVEFKNKEIKVKKKEIEKIEIKPIKNKEMQIIFN